MFRAALGFVAVAIMGFTSPNTFGQEKMSATGLLKKAIEATGGEAAIKKYQASKEHSKGTMDLNGLEIPFSGDSFFMSPDKMKNVLSLEVMGMKMKAVQVINGDKIRMMVNGMDIPVEEAAKTEMKEGLLLHKVAELVPLLDSKQFDVKLQDKMEKVGDADNHVLTVKCKGLRETKIFFDSKTFLISKLEKRGLNAAQQEGNQEMFLSDYKKVEGLMLPMKSKVLHDGKKFLESETTEVKLLDKIPDTEFDVSD